MRVALFFIGISVTALPYSGVGQPAAPPVLGTGTLTADHVNVRTRPNLTGEVIGRVSTGDEVTVIERVSVPDPEAEAPAEWYKIRMPKDIPVWVSGMFIDAASSTVIPERLNVRSGPGENHSIVDRVPKGTRLTKLGTQTDWLKVAPTPGAQAYIAAQFVDLSPASSPPVESVDQPEPETTAPPEAVDPAPVAESTENLEPEPEPEPIVPVTEEPAEALPVADDEDSTNVPLVDLTSAEPTPTEVDESFITFLEPEEIEQLNEAADDPVEDLVEIPSPAVEAELNQDQELPDEPLVADDNSPIQTMSITVRSSADEAAGPASPPRKPTPADLAPAKRRPVTREGTVAKAFSIQAPSRYKLKSVHSGKTINYLASDSPYLNLDRLKGTRIRVEGDEFVDPKWPRTPVLEIKKVVLVR